MASMISIPRWYERQFAFTFPAELYPNICLRLRGTSARVEELVRNCSREILTRKPDEKWSAQEHIGHLLDLEPLWLKRLEDFVQGRAELSTTDLSNRKTHEANYNSQAIEDVLADFRKTRLRLVERAAEVDPASYSRVLLHPRLQKPMRLVDHLYFVAEHDDHHLASIWQLIR
jgi:uncharacterized damage-inducible protein DinB